MKSKKFISALLAAAVAVSCIPVGASAQSVCEAEETEYTLEHGAYDSAMEQISAEAVYETYEDEEFWDTVETEEAEEYLVPEISYSKLTYNSVTLNWDTVNGAAKYRVYRFSPTKAKYLKYKDVTTNSLSVTGLKAKKEYKFYVAALDSSGKELVRSTNFSVTTPAKPSSKLAAPTGLIASAKTEKTITLKWNKVSGASAYRVYKYDSSTGKFVKYKNVSKTTCKVSGLSAGTSYKFMVAALVKKDGKYQEQTRTGEYTVSTNKKAASTTTDGKNVKPGNWKSPKLGDSMSKVLKNCGIGYYTIDKDKYTTSGKRVVGVAFSGSMEMTVGLYFNSDGQLYEYMLVMPSTYSIFQTVLSDTKSEYNYDYDYSGGFYFFGPDYARLGLYYDSDNKSTVMFVSSSTYEY